MTLEQLIYDRFPFVQCSIESGVGWHELIYKMCVEIDDLYFDDGKEVDIDILQIKEKWGSLSIYYDYPYDKEGEVLDIISEYEQLSKSTCEICGAEGKLLGDDYWVMVRCEDCL